MTNAIAVVKQVLSQPVNLDAERRDLIRKTICPPNTNDLEFEYFCAFAQRVELDPLLKQVWLVPRKQKDPVTRAWVEKMEPMVAEIGMRARADRLPDYRGTTGDYVCEGDEFMIDAGAGTVHHRYSNDARRKAGNKVIGAWARVEREGRRDTVVYVTFDAKVQTYFDYDSKKQVPTPFWIKDPGGQTAKCARAAALRLAYPDVFSGMFIAEESRSEGAEDLPTDETKPAATASDAMEKRLREKLGVQKVEPKPLGSGEAAPPWTTAGKSEPEPAKTSTERISTEAPKPDPKPTPAKTEKPKAEAKPKATEIPLTHLRFGKAKGAALADVSGVELEEALEAGRAGLAKAKGEPWVAAAREGITAIDAEIKRREADEVPFGDEPAPEPGSEG